MVLTGNSVFPPVVEFHELFYVVCRQPTALSSPTNRDSREAAPARSPRRKPWVGCELQIAEPRSGDSNQRPAAAALRLGTVWTIMICGLKPAAWLINTSRGSVADEGALYDALRSGRLAGAGLDVFQTEPYVPVAPDKDLRQLDNVVLTPHVGSNTHAANRRMAGERPMEGKRTGILEILPTDFFFPSR